MINIKCKVCREYKPESEYHLFRGHLTKSCNDCRIKNNQWYAQDLDGRRTRQRKWYQETKARLAQYRSDLRLDRKYSLDRERWNAMLIKQDGKCAICGDSFEKYKPCVDHDHKTGRVRGLLCRRCNLDLQRIEDEEFVAKAQLYLKSMN